jgi:hypothetical protein
VTAPGEKTSQRRSSLRGVGACLQTGLPILILAQQVRQGCQSPPPDMRYSWLRIFHKKGSLVRPPPPENTAAVPVPPVPIYAHVPPVADDALSTLKTIAEVGVLFLAVSFAGGWSFMASYYVSFGVNPYELEFSVPATSSFAVQMLFSSFWPIPSAIFIYPVLFFVYWQLGKAGWGFVARAVPGFSIAGLLLGVAYLGSWHGRTQAAQDVFETSAKLPSVGFTTKAPMEGPNCLARGTTDCRLLLHTKGTYYFFEPLPSRTSAFSQNGSIKLYLVPDSEIRSARLVRGLQ